MIEPQYLWNNGGSPQFPNTNPATLGFLANGRKVLDFTAGSPNKSVIFPFNPAGYAGGTLKCALQLVMASATANDVDVDVQAEFLAMAESATSDSFDTANSTDNTTVPGTAGLLFEVVVTLTNKDGIAAQALTAIEAGRVTITRDSVSDTATGAMRLVTARIWEE